LFGRSYWPFEDIGQKVREDELNFKYHQGQQEMVNLYFERYQAKQELLAWRNGRVKKL
jgi:hypothetical protein